MGTSAADRLGGRLENLKVDLGRQGHAGIVGLGEGRRTGRAAEHGVRANISPVTRHPTTADDHGEDQR